MLSQTRSLLGLQRTLLPSVEFLECAPVTQLVRWRKRRWAPPSAKKMWYVREKKERDPRELEKLQHLTQEYTLQVNAIKKVFQEEYKARLLAEHDKESLEAAAKEYARRAGINDLWNAETEKIRVKRMEKLEIEEEEKKLQIMETLKKAREEQKETARKLVEKELIEAKHFIKPENLVEEIEKALNSRVNYNFAIDLHGNRYMENPDGSVMFEEQSSVDSSFITSETAKEETATLKV